MQQVVLLPGLIAAVRGASHTPEGEAVDACGSFRGPKASRELRRFGGADH